MQIPNSIGGYVFIRQLCSDIFLLTNCEANTARSLMNDVPIKSVIKALFIPHSKLFSIFQKIMSYLNSFSDKCHTLASSWWCSIGKNWWWKDMLRAPTGRLKIEIILFDLSFSEIWACVHHSYFVYYREKVPSSARTRECRLQGMFCKWVSYITAEITNNAWTGSP